jgi:predicted dithiol-disulfide oxidoreductase (DUF899 family)
MTEYTGPTAAEAAARARAMEALPERERDVLITRGRMAGTVIDARHRFDPDRGLPTLDDMFDDAVTVTVFEGVFGPEDVA